MAQIPEGPWARNGLTVHAGRFRIHIEEGSGRVAVSDDELLAIARAIEVLPGAVAALKDCDDWFEDNIALPFENFENPDDAALVKQVLAVLSKIEGGAG